MGKEKKKLNVDQVAWLQAILDRYKVAVTASFPSASRLKDVARLGAVLEIMDLLGYEFEDSKAAGNAISNLTEFNKLRGYDD